jgi:hypothetical protein
MPGRPPAEWASEMVEKIKKDNPDYTDEQARSTMGAIWHKNLSESKKQEITKRKEGKRRVEAGFEEVNVPVTINKIKYDLHDGIEFIIEGINPDLYDEQMKDYIGAVVLQDEPAIEAFRKAGYTDEEISSLFDEARSTRRDVTYGQSYDEVDLPKPVTIDVGINKWGFKSSKKRIEADYTSPKQYVEAYVSKMPLTSEIDAYGIAREQHIEPISAEQELDKLADQGILLKDGSWYRLNVENPTVQKWVSLQRPKMIGSSGKNYVVKINKRHVGDRGLIEWAQDFRAETGLNFWWAEGDNLETDSLETAKQLKKHFERLVGVGDVYIVSPGEHEASLNKKAVNYVKNDKGETVIAIGAPGSIERVKVEYPGLIEDINEFLSNTKKDEAFPEASNKGNREIVLEMIKESGITTPLETSSVLEASNFYTYFKKEAQERILDPRPPRRHRPERLDNPNCLRPGQPRPPRRPRPNPQAPRDRGLGRNRVNLLEKQEKQAQAFMFPNLFSSEAKKWLEIQTKLEAVKILGGVVSTPEQGIKAIDQAVDSISKQLASAVEPEVKRIMNNQKDKILDEITVSTEQNIQQPAPPIPSNAPPALAPSVQPMMEEAPVEASASTYLPTKLRVAFAATAKAHGEVRFGEWIVCGLEDGSNEAVPSNVIEKEILEDVVKSSVKEADKGKSPSFDLSGSVLGDYTGLSKVSSIEVRSGYGVRLRSKGGESPWIVFDKKSDAEEFLDEIEDENPSEDDAFIHTRFSDYDVSFEGKNIGASPDLEGAIDLVKSKMLNKDYYPAVWLVSDHGNVELINIWAKGVKTTQVESLDDLEERDWEHIFNTAKKQQAEWNPVEDGELPEEVIMTSIGYVNVGLWEEDKGFVSGFGQSLDFDFSGPQVGSEYISE